MLSIESSLIKGRLGDLARRNPVSLLGWRTSLKRSKRADFESQGRVAGRSDYIIYPFFLLLVFCHHVSYLKLFSPNIFKYELTAFVAYWLSLFVFSSRLEDGVSPRLFPLAIHIAQG